MRTDTTLGYSGNFHARGLTKLALWLGVFGGLLLVSDFRGIGRALLIAGALLLLLSALSFRRNASRGGLIHSRREPLMRRIILDGSAAAAGVGVILCLYPVAAVAGGRWGRGEIVWIWAAACGAFAGLVIVCKRFSGETRGVRSIIETALTVSAPAAAISAFAYAAEEWPGDAEDFAWIVFLSFGGALAVTPTIVRILCGLARKRTGAPPQNSNSTCARS